MLNVPRLAQLRQSIDLERRLAFGFLLYFLLRESAVGFPFSWILAKINHTSVSDVGELSIKIRRIFVADLYK